MRSVKLILAGACQSADQEAPLYEGAGPAEAYTARHRAFAYTALITVVTVFALFIGGTIDYGFTIMLYVHLVTLIILLILFGVLATTRYRPGEGALLTVTLLDALAFAYYGYTMTTRFFTLLSGLWLTLIAVIVAFGCILVLVLGFALLAR
jgi:hypothetical protein